MMRRSHQAPERGFENHQDFGIQASIGTLLDQIASLRTELSKAQARTRTEKARSATLSARIERSQRRATMLQSALSERLKPAQRRRKASNNGQASFNLYPTR